MTIIKLIKANPVNGCKPIKYFYCEKCVFNSGKHTCKKAI